MKWTGLVLAVILSASIFLGAGFLGACGSSEETQALEGPTWVLTSWKAADGTMVDALTEVTVTATFDSGRVGGSGGCNSYGGTYTVGDGTLKISEIVQTLMACEEPSMEQEGAFVAALEATTAYAVEGATLTLKDGAETALLTFEIGETES